MYAYFKTLPAALRSKPAHLLLTLSLTCYLGLAFGSGKEPVTLVEASRHESLEANSVAKSAETSLQMVDGRSAINVKVNGQPIRANFDSGAQGMMISRSLAESMKLPIVGEALMGSPAGGVPVAVKVAQLADLEVGGVGVWQEPRSLDGVIVDDEKMPRGVQLILSGSNFPQTQVELDFTAQKFRMAPSSSDSLHWLPLDERGLTATTLTLNHVDVPLHVDTGNPGVLDVPLSIAEKLPLTKPLKPYSEIKLVDKAVRTQRASLETDAQMGGVALKLSGEFQFAPFPFANMGAGALSQARLQIDHTKKRWRVLFTEVPVVITGSLIAKN